ncbi:MAG: peptide ABC transporter substrate-binding protein [Anaerolineales bacterium]|nr:peptide ABC transporter substrate-binding protein [Anaerolineales bacterium]
MTQAPAETNTPAPTPLPPRVLTICLGQEPTSLFLYGDVSLAARSVRQAIYDGPYDVVDYQLSPVILERMPNLASGEAAFEPITIEAGNLIVNGDGELVNLVENVSYRPAGCMDASCAATYSGQGAVQMDQQVVRFKLRLGVQWSDGAPLTADDSVFSFEVAKSLYPRARAELIAYTASYQVEDDLTVVWRGTPGYRNAGYAANFFTPLPRHAWGDLPAESLLDADISTRTPLGWGPYVIDEWTPGDHISLSRNPNYFRSAQGLPAFDTLVFRFMPDEEEALAALLAGECDYLDETTGLERRMAQLLEFQQSGKLKATFETGAAWEHLDFSISPMETSSLPRLFSARETRQAIAMCLDRQRMVDELFLGASEVPDSYAPSAHPLHNPDLQRYAFDIQAATALLDAVGWVDSDGDPNTARLSVGVDGIADGTSLSFTFLTTDEDEKQRVAQMIQESLAQCGIQVQVGLLPWEVLFAPGPEGPIFGRNFSATQFGWAASLEPPCFLYTSSEIPGPYPQHPKGWGGANASGYSNPAFDQACQQALSSLPDFPEHQLAHYQAQAIFAEDLPAIPLYLRVKAAAMRADLCGVIPNPSAENGLWNLERFDYGEGCAGE